MQRDAGGFASAQDSESTVDGERVEGGYYALSEDERAQQTPPAIDAKVLTGWNGLAIEALAASGSRLDHPEWIAAARRAADFLLEHHVLADRLVRVSIEGTLSAASATLEDYGMLANGLLELALATGEARYAVAARALVDATLASPAEAVFSVPGGADPVLEAHGLALQADPSEGAYPSGLSAMAAAAQRLYSLTADARYRDAARVAMELFAPLAVQRPIAFGAALGVMSALGAESTQLVVVTGESSHEGEDVASVARAWQRSGAVVVVVTGAQAEEFAAAGFELFEARTSRARESTAYFCRDFVCALPVTDAASLLETLPA
jgi:uncharacterized protein YyaL (SSP411 family)